jgi:hypothetical protein
VQSKRLVEVGHHAGRHRPDPGPEVFDGHRANMLGLRLRVESRRGPVSADDEAAAELTC